MCFTKPIGLLILAISLLDCSKPDKPNPQTNPDDYGEYEINDPNTSQKKQTHLVEIRQMKFVPDELNIHAGDTIIWINRDLVDHDITEVSRNLWTSGRMSPGSSWKTSATESQVYFCSLHVVMQGKIIVDGKTISMINTQAEIALCK